MRTPNLEWTRSFPPIPLRRGFEHRPITSGANLAPSRPAPGSLPNPVSHAAFAQFSGPGGVRHCRITSTESTQVRAGFWKQGPVFLLPAGTNWPHCA